MQSDRLDGRARERGGRLAECEAIIKKRRTSSTNKKSFIDRARAVGGVGEVRRSCSRSGCATSGRKGRGGYGRPFGCRSLYFLSSVPHILTFGLSYGFPCLGLASFALDIQLHAALVKQCMNHPLHTLR